MAGATYVLDKTHRVEEANGISKNCAVIAGTADDQVKLTTAVAGAYSPGIAQETSANTRNIAIRKFGIARAIAAGAITRGAAVELAAGTAGKVQAATLTAGSAAVHYILGTAETTVTADGEIVMVLLNPHFVSVPAS